MSESQSPKNPLAAFLSLIFPGLGQIAQKEWVNGLSLILATWGMLILYRLDSSWLTRLCLAAAYLSLAYQSAKDAYHRTRNTETIRYILGLAVVIGPFCLPLLWQNAQLSRRAKGIWTLIVLALSLLAYLSWKVFGF